MTSDPVNVPMDVETAERLDAEARKRGMTRDQYIAHLLARQQRPKQPPMQEWHEESWQGNGGVTGPQPGKLPPIETILAYRSLNLEVPGMPSLGNGHSKYVTTEDLEALLDKKLGRRELMDKDEDEEEEERLDRMDRREEAREERRMRREARRLRIEADLKEAKDRALGRGDVKQASEIEKMRADFEARFAKQEERYLETIRAEVQKREALEKEKERDAIKSLADTIQQVAQDNQAAIQSLEARIAREPPGPTRGSLEDTLDLMVNYGDKLRKAAPMFGLAPANGGDKPNWQKTTEDLIDKASDAAAKVFRGAGEWEAGKVGIHPDTVGRMPGGDTDYQPQYPGQDAPQPPSRTAKAFTIEDLAAQLPEGCLYQLVGKSDFMTRPEFLAKMGPAIVSDPSTMAEIRWMQIPPTSPPPAPPTAANTIMTDPVTTTSTRDQSATNTAISTPEEGVVEEMTESPSEEPLVEEQGSPEADAEAVGPEPDSDRQNIGVGPNALALPSREEPEKDESEPETKPFVLPPAPEPPKREKGKKIRIDKKGKRKH